MIATRNNFARPVDPGRGRARALRVLGAESGRTLSLPRGAVASLPEIAP